MSESPKDPSPSRTYVAICNKSNFQGHYFRKFILPKGFLEGYRNWDVEGDEHAYQLGSYTRLLDNTHRTAIWYFLNELNSIACIEGVYTWEDFSGEIKDQDQLNRQREEMLREMLNQPEISPEPDQAPALHMQALDQGDPS